MDLPTAILSVIAIIAIAAALMPAIALVEERQAPTLGETWQTLKTREYVDRNHAFRSGVPHWSGFPDGNLTTLYD